MKRLVYDVLITNLNSFLDKSTALEPVVPNIIYMVV